jgi:DNA-binding NarL/FixJ family response regulator
MTAIRVLIAEDHAIVRAGLRLLIQGQPDMQVVGEAGTGSEVIDRTRALKPDVLTLDLIMPGARGIDTVKSLKEECPQTRVLVLTMHDDPASLRAVLTMGAAGYIVKSATDVELLSAIRAVHEGRTFISLGLPASVVQAVLMTDPTPRNSVSAQKTASALSSREQEVLKHLVQGYTNQETADQLFLSVKTIETYRARLMAKLELNSRADLVRYAAERGLLGDSWQTGKP